MAMTRSEELFSRALELIPGGVNSPVRAFRAVGGTPRVMTEGHGPIVTDADGRSYVDYVQSWGALLFGHGRQEVVEAAIKAAERGTSFGALSEGEILLAERVVDAVPGVEAVRLVSSGTEATMSAVRLARGFTGRTKVLKFEGCYHGHSDALLARAGSGVAALGVPDSAGVTRATVGDTVVLPYNDLDRAAEALDAAGGEVACVIVEPVAANMGVVSPAPGFLEGLRSLCDRTGALLVFDEVITGFRLAYGGAQKVLGVTPDLTCLGKVMGGGFPCAAFGGRRDVMRLLAPLGPVYQAGTLSGNPVAVAAGLAALELAEKENPYDPLRERAERVAGELGSVLEDAGVPHVVNRTESLFSLFFAAAPVEDYAGARSADHDLYARFFSGMLDEGVYLPPSGYEAWFLSAAHGDEEISRTLEAARRVAPHLR